MTRRKYPENATINDCQHRLDDMRMDAGQQRNAQGDPKKGRRQQPPRRTQVDFFPVLGDDDGSDGDRQEHY